MVLMASCSSDKLKSMMFTFFGFGFLRFSALR